VQPLAQLRRIERRDQHGASVGLREFGQRPSHMAGAHAAHGLHVLHEDAGDRRRVRVQRQQRRGHVIRIDDRDRAGGGKLYV